MSTLYLYHGLAEEFDSHRNDDSSTHVLAASDSLPCPGAYALATIGHCLFRPCFGESVPIGVEWEARKSALEGMPEDDKARFEAAVESECNRWKQEMSTAMERGQKFFMHTHPYFIVSRDHALEYLKSPSDDRATATKPVLVPDELLLNPKVRPFIVIRHPYLWIPSVFRAATSNVKLGNFGDGGKGVYYIAGNLTWAHELFDWYTSRGTTPTVVDAEDFLGSEAYVKHLCEKVGLSPNEAKLSWEKGSGTFQEEMPELLRNIQEQLLNSTGPRPSRRARDVDLDAEQTKWDGEFGEDAKLVRELVDLAMPHYESLWSRRLAM